MIGYPNPIGDGMRDDFNNFSNTGYIPPDMRMNPSMYSRPSVQQITPNQQQISNIVWVQGYEAAKAYMMPRNSSLILLDSEGTHFYIKSTDATGMPKVSVYQFSEVTDSYQNQRNANFNLNTPTGDFVEKNEFNELKRRVEQYEAFFNTLISNNPSVQVPVQQEVQVQPAAPVSASIPQQEEPSQTQQKYPTMAQAAQMLSNGNMKKE